MSRDVSGGFYGSERTDKVAISQKSRGAGFDPGQTTLDPGLGFTRQKRGVGGLLQERQAAGAGDHLDICRAELFDQAVDGAHVVHMGMRENDAAKGAPSLAEAAKMSSSDPPRPASTRVSPSASRIK
jgi:hypothetical protein